MGQEKTQSTVMATERPAVRSQVWAQGTEERRLEDRQPEANASSSPSEAGPALPRASPELNDRAPALFSAF